MNKYIICNLKANKTLDEIKEYKNIIDKIKLSDNKLIICPPTPYLYLFQNMKYNLGSQDVSSFLCGSFTGETTAKQLASLNT